MVIHLQRTYGNRYVQRLVESMGVQAKLTVNAPNDVYEQEANRVAGIVTKSLLQRQAGEEELMTKPAAEVQRQPTGEEEEEVQMQPGGIGSLKMGKGRTDEKIEIISNIDTAGSNESVVLQRETEVNTENKESKNDFADWARQITSSGDLSQAFGITWPANMKKENGDIEVTLWKHAGLRTDEPYQNVDNVDTDENNWKNQLEGMLTMGLKGGWYSKQAVEAHEAVHEDRFKAGIPSMESKLTNMLKEGEVSSEPASEYDKTNPLAYCRSECNKIGKEDHSKGSTDQAELNIILPKIRKIWQDAVEILKAKKELPEEEETREIESGYQRKYRIPLPGRGNFLEWGRYKTIKQLKFKKDGTVEE